MKSLLNTCLLIASVLHAGAQIQRCHTMEYLEELKKTDPQIEQRIQGARKLALQYANSAHPQKRSQVTILVPVVVHVLHNGEAIGTGKNISDAQILSQMEVLNEDYQALNADFVNVPAHFTSVTGNPEIQFCLATTDPQGNPTNGIDRIDIGPSGTWSDNMKPGTIWDATEYLNIWVSQLSGGTLGYTTFPGTSLNYDGVVIDYRYFGKTPYNTHSSDFNLGRTATHEIGHWLGLEHTFQGGCSGTSAASCGSSGDGICDTPPTSNANYGCNLSTTRNTCTETPVDQPDMWMNFLDYMDDECLYMFTQGQVDVMRGVLNTTRDGILSSTACDAQNVFSYSGRVVDAETGQGVANAKVLFYGSRIYELEADASGNFNSPNFRAGSYAIYAGKWGYLTKEFSADTAIDSTSSMIIIPIEKGYYDDFLMDYGWSASGNAASGLWERAVPAETDFNGMISNPGQDTEGDFGEKCYVTGNGGGSAGSDDVDDGNVILTSPVFDISGYNDPYLSYYRWFFNDGGNGDPLDDSLLISISNGVEAKLIETVDAGSPNTNQWNFNKIRISDYITPTASMQFMIETSDQSATGHLVEAALDEFKVVDSLPTVNASAIESRTHLYVYPNPASDVLNIHVSSHTNDAMAITVIDLSGKIIQNNLPVAVNATSQIDITGYPKGIYCVKLLSEKGVMVRKFTVLR